MTARWFPWILAVGFLAVPVSLRAGEFAPVMTGQLLYSRLTNGTWQIWKTDLSTYERTQVTFSQGDKRYPAWTPDGKVIYHTSTHACYKIRDRQSEEPVFANLWPIKDLAWSPDGKQIAFSKFRTELVDNINLWIADADGENPRLLTHEPGIQHNSAWSPDGKQIAYVGGHGYGTYDLFLVNVDGTGQRRLTQTPGHEFLPAWSPNGDQIIYSSNASGDYEIWIVKADGTDAKQLTRSPGLDTRPIWSPDGKRILFVTNRSNTLEIWMMNADGTEQQPLEQAEGGVCDPAWR